jgi:hypothetical protein
MKSAFLKTLRDIRARWYLVLVIVFVDVLFFYFFGKTYATIFQEVSVHLDTINALLQTSIGGLTQNQDPNALQIGIEQFTAEFTAVKLGIVQILTWLWGFWTFLQGGAWYAAHQIAGTVREKRFFRRTWTFIWQFVVATLVGYGVFLALLGGILKLSFIAFSNPIPLLGQTGINLIAGIGAFVFLYFLTTSYAAIGAGFVKRFLRAAFYNFTDTGLAYVITLGILFLLGQTLALIAASNVILALAFGIIIVLPVGAALRVFLVEVVRETT